MRDNRMIAKMLNASITGNKFENRDVDEYIYASLSQPPIKIIDKNDSDDELDYTVECPNCGNYVNYGTQIFMRSGHLYCNNKGCLEKLEGELKKMNDEDVIFLTKEEAISIAKFNDEQIHCFINPVANMLVGADHSRESFLKDLDTAKEIEIGGDNCRKMGHALVLWQDNTPYFFEHNEDKLKKLLESKGIKDE